MARINLHLHYDAAHGWLAAPTKLIKALGIGNQISTYSYIHPHGEIVYLEEDVDANLLTNALEALDVYVEISTIPSSTDESKIRRYDRFYPEFVESWVNHVEYHGRDTRTPTDILA